MEESGGGQLLKQRSRRSVLTRWQDRAGADGVREVQSLGSSRKMPLGEGAAVRSCG